MNSYAIGGWLRLRGEGARKREWMTRAVGILLGISTTRPVMGVFFATSARTHLGPDQFFGIAFWIGLAINAVVSELWLHSKRRAQLHNPALSSGNIVEQSGSGSRMSLH
jgi:prepilin signal peptidase PulO-like enzyme (type II secretory pathway)